MAFALRGLTDVITDLPDFEEGDKQYFLGFYDEKDELTAALHEALPPFMMPNTVKRVDQMPLTKNGKIDRAALTEM